MCINIRLHLHLYTSQSCADGPADEGSADAAFHRDFGINQSNLGLTQTILRLELNFLAEVIHFVVANNLKKK